MQANKPIHSSEAQLRLKVHARQMRQQPTPSEAALWHFLRKQRLGVQFRRQRILGSAIVDFYAPRIGLVVEVDGGCHALTAAADARRDRRLRKAGYTVLRVSDRMVLEQPALAVAYVLSAVRALSNGVRVIAA